MTSALFFGLLRQVLRDAPRLLGSESGGDCFFLGGVRRVHCQMIWRVILSRLCFSFEGCDVAAAAAAATDFTTS